MKHQAQKILITASILIQFLFAFIVYAQPQGIPYQAVARDIDGNPVASQAISVRFSIHDSIATGTVVFSETHSLVTSPLGLFSVNIGEGSVVSGSFSGIDWGSNAKFLQVEMDITGGTTYADMGTQQMMSVPYALHAANGNFTKSGDDIHNTNSGNVGIGISSPDPSAILDASSSDKGFLMPRMTTEQRDAIVSPAIGLQIFNLDDQCVDIYDGSNWIKTCGLKVTGNITDPDHPTPNSWTQKADFGGASRLYAIGFSIGSKGYIGTGFDIFYKGDFWEFDPANNAWTQKANFGGTARYAATGFSIGSKGYVGTGYDGSYKNDFWEYDPAGNTWTQKASFSGGARLVAVGFSIGSKGYMGTGLDDVSSLYNDFWEYDSGTDAWTQKADFSGSARDLAVGFSIGNKGYIGTGNDGAYKNDFWEYEPGTNTWTQRADFSGTARIRATGFFIGNKGYIGIGNDGTDKNDFWEYDPAGNNWTQKASFGGTARVHAVGFSIGSKGYIGTGNDGSPKNDFWEYMDDNVIGIAYSSNTINTTNSNSVSDGAWTLQNNNVFNANSGNVGVGTTAPSYLLEVNGDAAKPGGGSWTAASDARLKQDVKPFTDGLQQLNAIRPVTYHYNEKSGLDTEPQYIGVLAQDLKEIAPYMVGTYKKDGEEYYNVDNSAMTYMLINGMKEQQVQIEAQQSEIETLKAENEKLKFENASFRSDIEQIKVQLGIDLKSQKD